MSIKISTQVLDAISYLPIYTSVSAYKVELINNTEVLLTLRSDPADTDTSITLMPGQARIYEAKKNTSPFNPNYAFTYGILASGTGEVKIIAS